MASIHFHDNNHPVFTDKQRVKGKFIEESVYFWWWKTLRLSAKYKKACANNGTGLKKIYDDFGDVCSFQDDHAGFKSWWYEKRNAHGDKNSNLGAYLFGEPPLLYEPELLTPEDVRHRLGNGWDERELAVFSVPNGLPVNEAIKRFSALYTSNPKRKEPNSSKFKQVSKALYPVLPTFSSSISNSSHTEKIRYALETYLIHQQYPRKDKWRIIFENERGAKPEKIQVADNALREELIVEEMNNFDCSRKKAEEKVKQIYMFGDRGAMAEVDSKVRSSCGATFSRRIKEARDLIAGVEQGIFPAGMRSNTKKKK
jgi:hypothetical protein